MSTGAIGESPVVVLNNGSVGIVETHYFEFAYPPHKFICENGRELGPVKVAYETYGRLNEKKDNAILIGHALTASAHVAGLHSHDDEYPGWWDVMIGPGKAFDTDKYFIICSNVLGSCYGTTGPSSINPETNRHYGYTFPIITIGDMVTVQKKLLDHLGITKVLSVVGGSMGGMQAIEWALRFPEVPRSMILIASGAWSNPQSIAIHKVGIQAIKDDPNFNDGDYYNGPKPDKGLAIARMIGHITYLNDKMLWEKFGRRSDNIHDMKKSFKYRFEIEKYLQYQGNKFVKRFDANSYIYIMRAIDMYDASEGYKNLDESFKRMKISSALLISFTSDWLFPSYQSEEIFSALEANNIKTNYQVVESNYGHDSFLLKYQELTPLIKEHLECL